MRPLPLFFALGGALFFGACIFPEVSYLEDDAAGGAGGGNPTTTAAAGMGGIGGDPMTTTTGGGGSGGEPLPCELANLGVTGLCPGNQKCTVTDPATGAVGCALAGSKDDWSTCVDDTDCKDGSWCDLQREVCKPFCRNVDDCSATQGECLRAKQGNGDDIPNNVKTCISMCNPVTAAPCETSTVTCAFIGMNQFDCALSGNNTLDSSCDSQADCAATLACIDSIGSACEQYCMPIGSSHPNCSFVNCTSINNPAVTWMGMEVGTCF